MYIYLGGLTKNLLIAPPMRLIYVGSPKKSFMWDRPLRMCESARSFRPSRLILSDSATPRQRVDEST